MAHAAIDRAGDADWYAIDVPIGSGMTVIVRRTGGTCGADALHATLLNPEARPMRWRSFAREPRWCSIRRS